MNYQITHLETLESEAIHIIREVVAEFERPALLFSGGRTRRCSCTSPRRPARPEPIPSPSSTSTPATTSTRCSTSGTAASPNSGVRLIVASVQESIDRGEVVEDPAPAPRNRLQTHSLLQVIAKNRFDAVLGGGRRDEEKARAKERVFSLRDEFGQWDPRAQRPELWNLYNGRHRPGEHFRVFPLSNWTELDIWQYIAEEHLELPSIYFAHKSGRYSAATGCCSRWAPTRPRAGVADEQPFVATVRYRTVGDMTCTAAVDGGPRRRRGHRRDGGLPDLRAGATRADDRFSAAAMEDRKREGYF